MPRTTTLLVAATLLLAGLASLTPVPGAGAEEGAACEGYQVVPVQGPSCPVPGGWLVLLPDGGVVRTHGPDEQPPQDAKRDLSTTSVRPVSPTCVQDPTTQFHHLLVYAVPNDKPDRTAEMTPVLRDLVAKAGGLLRQETQEFGMSARYKFRCDGPNTPTLVTVRVPRPDADVTFASLVADLRAAGLGSVYTKHWVFYDGVRDGLYGQATIRVNDKLTSANGNSRGGDFAVVYGMTDPVYMMHENAHNLGAVQLTAPHSSGAGHCTDGLDLMCYFDAPDSTYNETHCTDRLHLDCNHDDYFHPNPPEGSWLATHWNLAHPYQRFLDWGRPNMAPAVNSIVCTPAVVDYDQPTTCRVLVDDDGDGMYQTVSVDGAPAVRHPATGHQIPGLPLTLTLRFGTLGTHTLDVTPTDDAKKPLTGPTVRGLVRVGCALERAGNLTGGALGMPSDASVAHEGAIPRACADAPFQLGGGATGDVDLCWLDAAGATLACHENIGDERGAIPKGAAAAKVVLKAGAAATYTLKGW